MITRLLIIGNEGEEHVGAHFLSAARQLKIDARLLDVRDSRSHSLLLNRISRHLLQRRPVWLRYFSRRVVRVCREFNPDMLLVTGISAPSAAALRQVHGMGISTANFLTDDPWNRSNAAGFFWRALREYDVVYSPRRANIVNLQQHGCARVEYLPFAYNPNLHFSEAPCSEAEWGEFGCDVAIVGGADQDRIPLARALAEAQFKLRLYGGFWDRWSEMRPYYHGFAQGSRLRRAVSGAALNICMVRRANRDGHAMRSYELPAMGGCMVVEDTPEHRQLFGKEGLRVYYFDSLREMLEKVNFLVADPSNCARLRCAAHAWIVAGGNTYSDRLQKMLDTI